MVRLLLEKGADVNTAGGKHGGALQAATDQRHKTVVQLLQPAITSQQLTNLPTHSRNVKSGYIEAEQGSSGF